MTINTQYTFEINLTEAIQISLLHQNHDHIPHDPNKLIGLMYLPIEDHSHTIFDPPRKCNQFTFQTQQYPETNNTMFIPPTCINTGAIFAIDPIQKINQQIISMSTVFLLLQQKKSPTSKSSIGGLKTGPTITFCLLFFKHTLLLLEMDQQL